jgi:hypothetical protein
MPVGTVALYSDGRVEKLIAIEKEGLRWEDDRMRQFLRSRNPIMPVLESRQRISGRVYSQQLDNGHPDRIRELPVGSSLHFSVVRNGTGGTKTRYWRCEFLGDAQEDIVGLLRDVEKYRCRQSSMSRKLGLRVRENREFTYSPSLGVITEMRQERTRDGRVRERRLVALFEPGQWDYRTLSRAVRDVRGD